MIIIFMILGIIVLTSLNWFFFQKTFCQNWISVSSLWISTTVTVLMHNHVSEVSPQVCYKLPKTIDTVLILRQVDACDG